MAQSLYARAAARGFPVENISGQSGQGALPDSTLPSGPQAGQPSSTWTDPNTDPGSVGAQLPPPEAYVGLPGLWGLPAAANPDDTPAGHAAPAADPTLPIAEYLAEADATHAPRFTGVRLREHPPVLARSPLQHDYALGGSGSGQEPLTGPMRALGGFDAVQGYGGGADGPGGVNASMPLVTDQKAYPGQSYTGAAFVSAGEVPLIVPQAGQFIAAAPELPPYMPSYDVPTANVTAQQIITADVPATGPALPAAPPATAAGFWG